MTTRPDDLVPKIARNEMFYFVARVCMLGASLIGLPLAGFMLSRVVAKADEISAQVSTQNIDLKILAHEFRAYTEKSSDHELRLRQLERK